MGKRIVRVIMVLAMSLAILITVLLGESTVKQQNVTSDPNVKHIVMTYQTIGISRTEELDQVVDAVNKISRERIGVEIELLQVDATESAEKYPLWITQGKRMDLMLSNYQDITNYTDHAMLLPLNELLDENGTGIQAISADYQNLFSGTTIDGKVYGVSIPSSSKGNCAALWISERYLVETGFDYEENQIYTLDDLDVLLANLKERYPNTYSLGQIPTQYNFSTSTFYLSQTYDGLGANVLTGVLDTKTGSTELVDYFELEEYYQWLTYMREWYQKGYVYPDAAITTSSNMDLVKAGIVLSIPHVGTPELFTEEQFNEPAVAIRLSPVTYTKQSSTGIFWTIPKTAKEPEAAMKFLNLMYTDETIMNLFKWGIEGSDYVMQKDGSVTWPSGKSQDSVSYYNPLGVYGDQRKSYALNSNDIKEKNEEFSMQAVECNLQYEGFHFDSASVGAELNQIQKVLDRYLNPLETGSVDLEQVYPEFIQELHDAGMDIVIAEKQIQFDAWLENNN